MRSLPDPGHADDDGAVDPAAAEALVGYAVDPDARHAATLAVLQGTRVLVPVVTRATTVEHDERGLARDKEAETAAVLMRGRDGRLALLAFTGQEPMRAWNPDARPVPVLLREAAGAAVDEGAQALVLDVSGPVLLVVQGDDLQALARGEVLVDLDGRWAWVHPR